MVITDTNGVICNVNAAFEQASGHAEAEVIGKRPNLMRSELQSRDFYAKMWRSLRQYGHWQGEIWNRSKSGHVFREWLCISSLAEADGQTTHFLGVYSGQSLPHLGSQHAMGAGGVDPVTGALDRVALLAAADRLHESHAVVALVVLDICRFTELNEHYGLRVGDSILRQLALRILRCAIESGKPNAMGRVGSDEFAVAWAPDQASEQSESEQIRRFAEAIQIAVTGNYEGDNRQAIAIEVSVGVSLMAAGQHQAANTLLHASTARHVAGINSTAVAHYEKIEQERRIVRALREDVRAGRIEVAYQPKVSLQHGGLTGLEALARWTSPCGVPVPPGTFIAIAERHGLIVELGDRVLECVLGQLRSWLDQGLPIVPVAINFSAAQFQRKDIASWLQEALRRYRIQPAMIEIELTESILLNDFDTALVILEQLRAVGVRLSIDDFGTGYSSLAYLRRFHVDALKLDRSFVGDTVGDPRTREIVSAVIALAHRLSLCCIAEGVETAEQREALRAMGCDEGQGYLIARPLCAQEIQQRFFTSSRAA